MDYEGPWKVDGDKVFKGQPELFGSLEEFEQLEVDSKVALTAGVERRKHLKGQPGLSASFEESEWPRVDSWLASQLEASVAHTSSTPEDPIPLKLPTVFCFILFVG